MSRKKHPGKDISFVRSSAAEYLTFVTLTGMAIIMFAPQNT